MKQIILFLLLGYTCFSCIKPLPISEPMNYVIITKISDSLASYTINIPEGDKEKSKIHTYLKVGTSLSEYKYILYEPGYNSIRIQLQQCLPFSQPMKLFIGEVYNAQNLQIDSNYFNLYEIIQAEENGGYSPISSDSIFSLFEKEKHPHFFIWEPQNKTFIYIEKNIIEYGNNKNNITIVQ